MTNEELDKAFKESLLKCRLAFAKEALKKNPKRGAFAEEYENFKKLLCMKLGIMPKNGGKEDD